MLGQPSLAMYQVGRYYNEKVAQRKAVIAKNLHDVCKVVQDILKEVEAQEPRFINTLTYKDDRYAGCHAISPTEFEVVFYLNQMGVFNFLDDGSVPGCAALKLSDGRKRSMSLWVEFITASGYLSARKIRSRFQTLVAQAVDKSSYRDCVKMIPDTNEVRLRVQEKFVVQITGSFRCSGIWPRSANYWPSHGVSWPSPNMAADVKSLGFDLFSKESPPVCGSSKAGAAAASAAAQSSSMEGDAWQMSFTQAEDLLLAHACRRKVFSILKALRDVHLEFHGTPVTAYILKTLVLFESEKHPHEYEWDEVAVGDRLIGILLQMVSCLQCRKCPHYFQPHLDLLKGKSNQSLDQGAKATWKLVRELIMNPRGLEML